MKFTGMHEFMHCMIFILFIFFSFFLLLFSASLLGWILEEPCGLLLESRSRPQAAISQLVHLSISGHKTALLCIILPPSLSAVPFLRVQH